MDLPGSALWDLFADGSQITTDEGIFLSHTLDLGYLTLPTGRIVVSDPFLDPWNKPFSVRVPPGAYPAFLSEVEGEVAAVMVYFGDAPPVSWQRTVPRSFIVDSATGCLMDHKVCRFLRRKAEADKYERYVRRFHEALDAGGMGGTCCIDPESGANVLLFRTYGGDGVFPSFFGYAEDGSLSCLVTDMFLSSAFVKEVQAPVS